MLGWPRPDQPGRAVSIGTVFLPAGLQPVDDAADLLPVARAAGRDELAQRLRADQQQRLRAGRHPAHERVVDQVLERHARAGGQALQAGPGVDQARAGDVLAEAGVRVGGGVGHYALPIVTDSMTTPAFGAPSVPPFVVPSEAICCSTSSPALTFANGV